MAEKKETKTQLYVSNLPSGATSERLHAAFAQFGEITDAFIPHRGSRFGFVDFKDSASATKALEMHEKPLDDEAKQSSPDDIIGVVRAMVRPASKERKPPAAANDKNTSATSADVASSEAKASKGQGRRQPADRPPKSNKKERNTTAPGGARAAEEDPPKEKRPPAAKKVTKAMLDAVADKLFKALSEQDWTSAGYCFAPSAQCFSPQRTGAKPQDFPGFRKTMGGMIGLFGKPEYLNVRRLYGADSITEQHTTKFAENEAAKVEAEACVLLRVNTEGKITRMDEYLDPTVVLKAVQTASRK